MAWVDRLPVGGKTAAGALGVVIAASIGTWGVLSNPGKTGACEKSPLRHVYHPQRLKVVAKCQRITVTVRTWRLEHDGDIHADVDVDGGGWTNAANGRQHGLTVIEFVPRDPRPTRFYAGERLEVLTTRVYDEGHRRVAEAHGWIEGHPVFASRILNAPIPPGAPPPAE